MRPSKKKFINRELSWLEFNQRVLDEAMDQSVPLLERLNFLAITSSNLDEFFMVRVGGLELMTRAGVESKDPSGMTPGQQLVAIHKRVRSMVECQTACLTDISEKLADEGVRRIPTRNLSPAQRESLLEHFEQEVFPVVTPIALHEGRQPPLIGNLGLYLAVKLAPPKGKRKARHAIVPLGAGLQRVLPVPSRHRYAYVLLEDVVSMFAGKLFPGQKVLEAVPFRITRHAAMAVEDEFASDLLSAMESVLDERRTSACVRLEIASQASERLVAFLTTELSVTDAVVYTQSTPLDLTAQRALIGIPGLKHLQYPPWSPSPSAAVDPQRGMFEQIAERNILLFHPYESFDPVVRLLEEAAADPDVLAIKQVLYRTSSGSPVISALRRAAVHEFSTFFRDVSHGVCSLSSVTPLYHTF